MPNRPGDDGEGLTGLDEVDDEGVLDDLLADDQGRDGFGGDLDFGEGLTAPERELADERNRTAEREAAFNRLERFARDGEMGGRGGAGSVESDALAIIEAAGRFGELDEDDDAERHKIADALSIHSSRPSKQIGEYQFFGIINSLATTATGQFKIVVTIPWEFREEVLAALETMPLKAMFNVREIADPDD